MDTILQESGKTMGTDDLPSREQLVMAIRGYEIDPDALAGKTSKEVRAILFAKYTEHRLPVRDEDMQRVLESTSSRKDENRPSERQIRFALEIGLTPEDLMHKSRKEIAVVSDVQVQSYEEEHRYQRILANVAQIINTSVGSLRANCPTTTDLMRFIENRSNPDGILRRPLAEMSSMKKQKYAVHSVIEFTYGSASKGKQSGTARVIGCKDSGFVVVRILSAKPHNCTEVSRPLTPGRILNLRPGSIRKVLSTPEETGAEEAA